ncbi:MAG: GntR family transcriptional regulator [Pseudomonadota bacterium]
MPAPDSTASQRNGAPGHHGGGGGIALYTKLAMSLRHRIATGEWAVGDQLPTVEQFAQDFNLGKITVRQALAQLAAEGLITSRRGRGTHVAALPKGNTPGLRSAINDMVVDASDLKIKVLDKATGQILPEALSHAGKPFADYVRILKLHVHKGVPFSLMEMYVATPIFNRFPRGAERRQKISHLLHDASPGGIGNLHQTITVEPASDVTARHLDYVLAAPVAKVIRVMLDKQRGIISAGVFWYRGDTFVLETEVPAELTQRYPSISIPKPRAGG